MYEEDELYEISEYVEPRPGKPRGEKPSALGRAYRLFPLLITSGGSKKTTQKEQQFDLDFKVPLSSMNFASFSEILPAILYR